MRVRGLGYALLLAIGCGGGGGQGRDAGRDAVLQETSGGESALPVEPRGPDGGVPVDTARVDSEGREAADTPGSLDTAVMDGLGALDTSLDGAAPDIATVDGAGQLDPCDPAAIVTLPLAGAGTVTESGRFLGTSHLQPKTPSCTTGATGPEVVYALALPAGVFHLMATTVSATGSTADTVLYVQSACGAGQELACNDDAEIPGPSRIATGVTGPGTVYIVVDSFNASPEPPANTFSLTVTLTLPAAAGAACTPIQPGVLDPCAAGLVCPPSGGATATCTTPTAPVLDSAELFPQLGQPATETTLFLSAHDGQGDWKALALAFRDAGGAVVDAQNLDLSDYWGEAALGQNPFALSGPAGTASVDVTIVDSQSFVSATVTAALTPWATIGQTCNAALAAPDPCLNDLVCTNATCTASSPATSACERATTVTLGTPVSGTAADLPTDTFEGSCVVDRGGNDKVFRATLPALTGGALAWDLVATTANASVPWDYYSQLDSYLYVRGNCVDPTTELGCNDDLSDTDLRSQVVARELAPGSYFVFLDTSSPDQNGTSVAYTFLVRARAVLPTGATCDPGNIQNRCRTGTCSALTSLCP